MAARRKRQGARPRLIGTRCGTRMGMADSEGRTGFVLLVRRWTRSAKDRGRISRPSRGSLRPRGMVRWLLSGGTLRNPARPQLLPCRWSDEATLARAVPWKRARDRQREKDALLAAMNRDPIACL